MERVQVIDAVMFEPNLWQKKGDDAIPGVVPSKDRSHLGTPCGLLFNELQHFPSGIVKVRIAFVFCCCLLRVRAGANPLMARANRPCLKCSTWPWKWTRASTQNISPM